MNFYYNANNLHVHFIGIGGVNMSALAAYLIGRGFAVSGSDSSFNVFCERLDALGATVYQGHDAKNVENANVVIVSSAINESNVEFKYAVDNRIPVYKRAELLKAISERYKLKIGVSGSHGKTTVTALLAHILNRANRQFTAFIGGEDKKFDNYVNLGEEVLLSEICEFQKNINYFDPNVAVVLNVDNDHLDSYKSFSELTETFFDFLNKAEVSVVNADDKILKKLSKNALSFGIYDKADYMARKIEIGPSNRFSIFENGKKLFTVNSKLSGVHNVYNVLAAVAVARHIGISKTAINKAICSFEGVARRNEYLGTINGAKCYSDYAHHPKELSCIIKTINSLKKGRLFFVFQPHTYSRTKILFNEFIEVLSQLKHLFIYKTYGAREVFSEAYSAKALSEKIQGSRYFDDFDAIINCLTDCAKDSDVVYFVGAGDIDALARSYVKTPRI